MEPATCRSAAARLEREPLHDAQGERCLGFPHAGQRTSPVAQVCEQIFKSRHVELRSPAPLLQLNLFKSAAFRAAWFAAIVALFSVVGTVFLLSLFLGYVQHLSLLQIGLRLLFISGVAVVFNPIIGMLIMPRVKVTTCSPPG